MSQKLLVATRNQGKVQEFAEMLAHLELAWLSLDDIGLDQDVAETGHTFQENAFLKAETYAAASGYFTLADDSGLEVDALNGEPGVYTARYGGPGLDYEGRYRLLLKIWTGWLARRGRLVFAASLPWPGRKGWWARPLAFVKDALLWNRPGQAALAMILSFSCRNGV